MCPRERNDNEDERKRLYTSSVHNVCAKIRKSKCRFIFIKKKKETRGERERKRYLGALGFNLKRNEERRIRKYCVLYRNIVYIAMKKFYINYNNSMNCKNDIE